MSPIITGNGIEFSNNRWRHRLESFLLLLGMLLSTDGIPAIYVTPQRSFVLFLRGKSYHQKILMGWTHKAKSAKQPHQPNPSPPRSSLHAVPPSGTWFCATSNRTIQPNKGPASTRRGASSFRSAWNSWSFGASVDGRALANQLHSRIQIKSCRANWSWRRKCTSCARLH